MKTNPRGGTAVRDREDEAPRESYAPGRGASRSPEDRRPDSRDAGRTIDWSRREPAPAGALLPRTLGEAGRSDELQEEWEDDRPYRPRRGPGAGLARLRRWPSSLAGRLVAGGFLLLLVGAAGVAVAAMRRLAFTDPRFSVPGSQQIALEGNRHLSRAQVLSVFGADLERNIFRVDLAERRADLERLPWVEHATVMRLLPDQLRVRIVERTPVAFVRQGTQIGLVDASGVLLDMPASDAGDPQYSFPVLTGVTAEQSAAERQERMQVYHAFMQELNGAAGERLTDTLSEVDLSDPEDVKALVTGGSTDVLVHFGDEQFLRRYREFMAHMVEWKRQYPRLASADMRYEGQIVLEMQPGTAGGDSGETKPAAAAAGDGSTPTATPAAVAKAEPAVVAAKAAKPVAAKPVGGKTVTAKTGIGKPVKPVTSKPVKKAAVGKAGTSAANERMYAALAAARLKAQAGTAKPAPAKPVQAGATGGNR